MQTAPLRVQVIPAGTTADESQGIVVDLSAYQNIVGWLTGTGTITSGVVTIEEADYPGQGPFYGGTWSTITTLTAANVTGGATQAYHFPTPAAYKFVRIRISTAIGGGGSIGLVLTAS